MKLAGKEKEIKIMNIKCKYLTRKKRCKLSPKDLKTKFHEKCTFLNGTHPYDLTIKELQNKKELLLQKADFICIASARCYCAEKGKKIITDQVQQALRKIDTKIRLLDRKNKPLFSKT